VQCQTPSHLDFTLAGEVSDVGALGPAPGTLMRSGRASGIYQG